MVGALTLSRAVAGTPLSDEILQAAKAMGEAQLDCSARTEKNSNAH